ncbi:MAG: hypothetical protein KDC70_10825, partial [Saprospiraceae bacterium]|nr:hypothetical protein [Saprospiraceae bacterium]
MKNQLLLSAIFLLCAFAGRSQCEPSPYCDLTPLFCGAVLDGYQGSTAGYPPPSSWVPFCGTLENPQFLKIITCSDLLDLSILSSNCQNGNGVQIALYTDCDNPEMVTCEEGFPGNAGGLLSIIATVETNTPYVLMIDGYAGDICDFVIDVNSGLDVWQSSSQPAQNGYIELDTLPCGPAQLTAHLPICWSDAPASPGCSISWQNSLATNCTGFNWNLPPGVEIVSNDPNAQTITIQFTQPVVNGIVSVNTYSSCWDICPTCGPNGCAGGFIPPLVISSDSSTFTYLPCQEAPFYCGNTLDGATISTVCTSSGFEWANPLINIQPDVDVFCYPIDNPNLYGFSSCSNQLSMSIQVDSCEKGKGLEFAVLYSNHCGSFMRISDCIAVQEDATAMLSFSNPYPGQPLYLAVDGLDFDACTFHIDVPDSVGSQAPTYIATDCAPEITGVVNTVCAGGVYTFKIEDLSGTSCVINAWNVISSYCAPPGGACKLLDSVEVTWTLPPFLHPIGDDNGPVLKVWADSSFATNDTLFSAVIRADIFTIATPTGLIDGFCGCANFSKQYESEFWIDAYSTVAKIPLTLSCLQPCVTVGSVTYCDPGEYIIAINGCQVYKHIVTKTDPPLVSSPVIQQNDDSYTVSFSVSPSNGTVVTGGGSFQNGTFTSLPIACGQPYAFNVITGSCTQTVSGSAACYLPPDCNNFNIPAPPGDSCHQAPLLCGNFLEGYCSTTAGLLPDQPAYLTSPLPDFENNGWLRFSPCEDSISIDFQVFDCQVGNELGFFLLSGDCDTLTPLAFTSATDGNIANLSVGGLNPGEVYYLVVDGFYGSECKFQVHVVSGIGTASPGLSTCTCTDGYIDGPGDLCPADIAVYTLILPSCDITSDPPFGGNGIYCPPPPSVCPAGQDSLVLHWVIPPFMNFLSDSINVLQITTQVDSAFLGQDTLLNGTVSVYWEVVDLPGDTIAPDTNAFCSCQSATCDGDINFKDVTVHHDVDYDYGVISCVNPCYFYNGVPYCQAGTYLVSQDNCHTQFLILVEDFSFPQANAGPDQTICLGEDATLGIPLPNSPIYSYYWDNGAFTPQTTVAPTNTTSYSLIVTNVFNGCTATDNVTVTVMPSIPATNLPPTSICEGECLLFAGEIICPSASGMQTTMLQSWFGCDSLVTQFIVVQPLLQIDLGVAGTIDCQNPSVDVMGNIYTQPGVYIIDNPGTCTAYTFTIAGNVEPVNLTLSPTQTICAGESVTLAATTDVSGSVLFNWSTGETGPVITVSPQTSAVYSVIATDPQNGCTGSATTQVLVNQPQTIQLGVVETLSCTQPCVTYNGETYCQPGSYSYTANCEVVA